MECKKVNQRPLNLVLWGVLSEQRKLVGGEGGHGNNTCIV